MRSTRCEIILNLEDTTAKSDSTMDVSDNSSFADINALKQEEVNISDYGTLELNQFVLDGTKQILPDDLNDCGFALLGTDLSSVSLTRNSVTLNVTFADKHKSLGVTFNFANDYPETIHITWFYNTTVLDGITYHPDSPEYFCENKVDGYNKLTVVFTGSKIPYRYLRLDGIAFGANITIGSDKIKSATILEEVNPISNEISINNLDFTMFDESEDFNTLNPRGRYELLLRGQKVTVREFIDDMVLQMGTFYLDSWDSDKQCFITFNAVDAIGRLGTTKFYKGRIYNQERAGIILDEIFESATWSKYEISADVYNTLLSGYIPICSHREALQQVLFALRAVADCSRSDKIKIYRTEAAADLKVLYNRKFEGGKVGVRNYVSAVDLTMHEYKLGAESKQLFNGTLSTGTSLITFSAPSSIQSISGGTLGEYGVNYAYVTVSADAEVTITGYEYIDNTSILTINNKNTLTGAADNVITVKDATLISKYNVYLVANHLMDYYALQREANQRFICEAERSGRWISMKSQYGRFVTGSITKMSLDLTGGFIADATIIGYNSLEKEMVFTGEIYTGEIMGVI